MCICLSVCVCVCVCVCCRNPRFSTACNGPAGNFTGNYTVGWVVLNGSDPTQIIARHADKTPWMNPVNDYETLCDADTTGHCKYTGANPWTIFLPSADPLPGQRDSFRVWWGAGDGSTGTGIVKVTMSREDTIDDHTD